MLPRHGQLTAAKLIDVRNGGHSLLSPTPSFLRNAGNEKTPAKFTNARAYARRAGNHIGAAIHARRIE